MPERALVELTGRSPGSRFDLDEHEIVLGSAPRADVRLDDPAVDARHAALVPREGGIVVKDLGSKRGTFVNERRIDEYALRDGDLLQVGQHLFRFLAGGHLELAIREEVFRLAIRDPLTGLASANVFHEALMREVGRHGAQPIALVLFDVDHMRDLAQRHGALAGDLVLKQVGQVLRDLAADGKDRWPPLRPDLYARSRGDRFAAAFIGAGETAARAFADAVRSSIKASRITYEGKLLTVTLSAGVASAGPRDDGDALIARAAAKLRGAKLAGRDRVL